MNNDKTTELDLLGVQILRYLVSVKNDSPYKYSFINEIALGINTTNSKAFAGICELELSGFVVKSDFVDTNKKYDITGTGIKHLMANDIEV